jgi:hypothetical protein
MRLERFIGSSASSLPSFRNPEPNWALNVAGFRLHGFYVTIQKQFRANSTGLLSGASSFLATSAHFFGKIETLCIERWSSSANFGDDANEASTTGIYSNGN